MSDHLSRDSHSHVNLAVAGLAVLLPGESAAGTDLFWERVVNAQENGTLPSSANGGLAPRQRLAAAITAALADAGLASPDATRRRVGVCVAAADLDEQSLLGALSDAGIPRTAPGDAPVLFGSSVTALKHCCALLRAADCAAVVAAAIEPVGRGGGCASAVVLRRMADVEADGAVPRAVLESFAAGKPAAPATNDAAAPLVRGICAESLAAAGVQPGDIGYVEVCGSGRDGALMQHDFDGLETPYAPAIPTDPPLPAGAPVAGVGPVSVSGCILAVVKASLCLCNRIVPPWPRAASLPEGAAVFSFNPHARPWINGLELPKRRATVSAWDADGSYSHLVLREAAANVDAAVRTGVERDTELVLLAARDTAELRRAVKDMLAYLGTHRSGTRLIDVAAGLARRFDPTMPCRLALVSSDPEHLARQLGECLPRLSMPTPKLDGLQDVYFRDEAATAAGKVAWIFPGLGFPGLLGTYPDRLMELCLNMPAVRSAFDGIDYQEDRVRDGLTPARVFFPPPSMPEAERKKLRGHLAAPRAGDAGQGAGQSGRILAPFGVAVAHWLSWRALGELRVPCDMMFGQSFGDLSALCAAGVLEFNELLPLYWRLSDDPRFRISDVGLLALVSATEEQLAPMLAEATDVHMALRIGLQIQIIGGPEPSLRAVLRRLEEAGMWTQLVPYPAVHTPRFGTLRPLFEPFLEKITLRPARVPVYSAVTAEVYPSEPAAISRMMMDNLDHSVHLWRTTRRMYDDGARIFIQVGGGAITHHYARTACEEQDAVSISTDVDHRSAMTQLNHLCALLLCKGVNPDIECLFRHRAPRAISLPAPSLPEADHAQPGGSTGPETAGGDGPGTMPNMPFVGHVVSIVPGREIVIERTLSLAEDLHLADHMFVHAPGVKPVSACCPVLPMTFSMEVMAEAAACLVPAAGLVGFEDIRASRWVAMEDREELPLRVTARVTSHDPSLNMTRVAVEMFRAAETRAATSATVLLGTQYLPGEEIPFEELTHPRPYPIASADIYRERHLFHGPLLQCVGEVHALGDRAVIGELVVLPHERLFASTTRPRLLTDPVVLDGVGQLVGLWALSRSWHIFPISVSRVELYSPTPPTGTHVPVYAQITSFDATTMYADIEVQDGSGHVWMRVRGWGDWIFCWQEPIDSFRRLPHKHVATHELALAGAARDCVCRLLPDASLRDFDPTILARYFLHLDEMAEFRQLAANAARQRQWLLGRMAAKDAARIWLKDRAGTDELLHPASFIIGHEPGGRPVVRGLPAGIEPPHISIAHSEDRAVGAASASPVGVDVEKIAPRDAAFVAAMCSPSEAALLAALSDTEAGEWIARAWAAKESVGKALGTGLDGRPKAIVITGADPSGEINVSFNGGKRTATVSTAVHDGFAIALALLRT